VLHHGSARPPLKPLIGQIIGLILLRLIGLVDRITKEFSFARYLSRLTPNLALDDAQIIIFMLAAWQVDKNLISQNNKVSSREYLEWHGPYK